jgi:hypothetical protein
MFRWPRNYAVEAFISWEGEEEEEEEEEEINQNLGQLNKHYKKQTENLSSRFFWCIPFLFSLEKYALKNGTLSYLSSYVRYATHYMKK